MGKFAGLLMIIAGVGTAAYVYPMVGTSSDKAEKQLADIVVITTAAEPKRPAAPTAVVVRPSEAVTTPSRIISADTSGGRPGLMAAAPIAPPAPSTVFAASPAATAKPVEAPVPQAAKRAKAEDEGRAVLTRDIQRELKRVGCLQGEADGTWNTSTKQAMKLFIDRVNATLPTDEPDHILKTLVQGHPGNACGKSCPAGQTASSEGRCLPTAIMTQGPMPVKRPAAAPSEVAAVAQPILKTPPAPAAVPAQLKATSAWETSVTKVSPPAMAAIAAAALATSSTASSTSDVKPLPGRMAIGAAAETASPVTAAKPAQEQVEPPRTKFVVRPKAPVAKVDKTDFSENAEKADRPEKSEKSEISEKAENPSRSSVGAVTAAERSGQLRGVASAPTPRVAIYRAPPPPPRYVGAYSPPARVTRPRFGPQIFRQLDMSGR